MAAARNAAGNAAGVAEKEAPPGREQLPKSIFASFAQRVDSFFERKFYAVGLLIGTRPWTSLGLSCVLLVICMGGFSRLEFESRPDKLWIPQGTEAQLNEAEFAKYFPPGTRFASIMLEAKRGSATDKVFLQDALALHSTIEGVSFKEKTLLDICIRQPANGHDCYINSVLGAWGYDRDALAADPDPLARLNAAMSPENLERLLGAPVLDGGEVTSAKLLTIMYVLQLNRVLEGGNYVDEIGEGWEEEVLKVLGCDEPTCSGDRCTCSYSSEHDSFTVYAIMTRSWQDAFSSVLQGDVGLTSAAFAIMINYLTWNLGVFGHKVKSRAILATLCAVTIGCSGAAGEGFASWFGFTYSPMHSILPFLILGIGVDDSFVIMNALDRTDASKPVPERVAEAISHAGVSIMVTSLTDFVAFAISTTSALPALSSWCFFAASAVLFLFVFQLTMFAPLASIDLRRVVANRPDLCCWLPKGLPCCPVVPQEEAAKAIERGEKDPNLLLCIPEPRHQGGRIGQFLEEVIGPQLVRKPVAAAVVLVFSGWCGLCSWQASQLAVQDTQRNFVPDDSYALAWMEKDDEFFGTVGSGASVMTLQGDYFASQRAFAALGPALDATGHAAPTSTDSYSNWATDFRDFCQANPVAAPCAGLAPDADGYATVREAYYAGLKQWLADQGARHAADIVWVDGADPQRGIKASRITFEIKSVNKLVNGKILPDAEYAIVAMDGLRAMCDAQTGLPGGECIAYARNFLSWETFKIIKREMFVSTGMCLIAVFLITLALISHPLTSTLVFVCVCMSVVDILGCMNMWGLAIDSITVIQLVITVGLSVDYSAHVGHNFMAQTGTREKRVIKTLGDVGAPVLCGGLSTFIGVMLLAFSRSYVFRVVFRTFFLTVVLGLAHGLLLLPTLLSLVGPRSHKAHASEVVAIEVLESPELQGVVPMCQDLDKKASEEGAMPSTTTSGER